MLKRIFSAGLTSIAILCLVASQLSAQSITSGDVTGLYSTHRAPPCRVLRFR